MKEKVLPKITKTAFLFSLLFSPLQRIYAQIEQAEVKFYVNNGTKEVKSLECYDFDNLMIKFKATPLLFGTYESVDFIIKKVVNTEDVSYYIKSFNPSVIRNAFSGKNEVSDWIFSSSDTKALSDYTMQDSELKFDRIGLQYTI